MKQLNPTNKKLEFYRNSTGLTESEIKEMSTMFEKNLFDIPVPSFKELFIEHAIAPFFVFQIFCVMLWCLDEYWYFSIFTLVMLIGFESTVVSQRLSTIKEFKAFNKKTYKINVFRNKEWKKVDTTELLPFDLCELVPVNSDELCVPCDMLLLDGSCIVNEAMLSGESTPTIKEAILKIEDSKNLDIKDRNKNNIVYGGTKILQVTPKNQTLNSLVQSCPENGSLAIVLKTGFNSVQGKLVRTMIFSTQRITANNKEALYFILFLLVFAIVAASYVWIEGIKNDLRSKSKLLLDCILIITSVVPPELPMELSMAVNTSLVALSKFAIFCTEPFRIPLGGKIDIICFDKTGTLTSENLIFEGFLSESELKNKHISTPSEINKFAKQILSCAHSLAVINDDEIVGDSMEIETLKSINYTLNKNNYIMEKGAEDNKDMQIVKRCQFLSSLKRMSTLAKYKDRHFVCTKGAPEIIKTKLNKVPQSYDETFTHYTNDGRRVLALAYKPFEVTTSVDEIQREELECDLIFLGFLVFDNPLKKDSAYCVKMLIESSHKVVIITGDNALTACHVARSIGLLNSPKIAIIDSEDDELVAKVVYSGGDKTESTKVVIEEGNFKIKGESITTYGICITGNAISTLTQSNMLAHIIEFIEVFARVSPKQKEDVLLTMKAKSYVTLMCGDGTNDVGALKCADVGIALLNGTAEDLTKISSHKQLERMKQMYDNQKSIATKFNLPQPPPPAALVKVLGLNNSNTASRGGVDPNAFSQKLFEMMDEEVPQLKMGDASVAAPFTSKLDSINSVCNIVRQGRCTLVATIQMYKILALNCLISAYSLSVLYLDGIKYGDYQATISGMLMTPIELLSSKRPKTNAFNMYVLSSVLMQFFIHVASLIYIVQTAKSLEPNTEKVNLEKKFEPGLLNSAVYLISLSMQVSTFAINYQGRPFREDLKENRILYYGLVGVGMIAFFGATELFPEMNQFLQLVPFSNRFRFTLVSILLLDFGLCYFVELFCDKFFGNKTSKIQEFNQKLIN